jgi:chromosomal replication initiation ATPase DnaA
MERIEMLQRIKEIEFEIKQIKAELNLKTPKKRLNEIVKSVCKSINISHESLISPTKEGRFAEYRHCICYVLYENENTTFKEIANVVGRNNHSTIIKCIEVVNNAIFTKDEKILKKLAEVEGAYYMNVK